MAYVNTTLPVEGNNVISVGHAEGYRLRPNWFQLARGGGLIIRDNLIKDVGGSLYEDPLFLSLVSVTDKLLVKGKGQARGTCGTRADGLVSLQSDDWIELPEASAGVFDPFGILNRDLSMYGSALIYTDLSITALDPTRELTISCRSYTRFRYIYGIWITQFPLSLRRGIIDLEIESGTESGNAVSCDCRWSESI